MKWAVVVMLGACGRVGFDGLVVDGNGDGAGGDDAAACLTCGGCGTCAGQACDPLEFTSLHMGHRSTIALTDTRGAWGWGANEGYTLQRMGGPYLTPVPVDIPVGARSIAIGSSIGAYIDAAGALWSWGTTTNTQPIKLSDGPWLDVRLGYSFGCVRAESDLHLACWGDNYRSNLGNGSLADDESRPVDVMVLGAVDSYAVDNWSANAIDTSGRLWSWGENIGNIGGTGTSTDTLPVPTQVGTDTDWTMVARGLNAACARKGSGALYCWGDQYYNGHDAIAMTPVQLGTRTDWVDVEGHYLHTCARSSGGEVWCWGGNGDGQLGTGNTQARFTPTRVNLPIAPTELLVGGHANCARDGNGPWVCWGGNDVGELGIGTTANVLTPTQRCP